MTSSKVYLVGGGLAGIAAAFYLIKDCKIKGSNITIFEEQNFAGGSLDILYKDELNAYLMRGFRMLEENVYSSLFDLLASVPTVDNPNKTLMDDFIEFNREVKTYSKSRLIKAGKAINARPLKLKFFDRIKILQLLMQPEHKIQGLEIKDFFSPSFFESNFWYEFCTTFSFQPWHSLEELKRYILRFIQCSPVLDSQSCIRSTRYNQYDSIVYPIKKWLLERGVCISKNSVVKDINFIDRNNKKRITAFSLVKNGTTQEIRLDENDIVFVTLASMTDSYCIGTMDLPPTDDSESTSHSWDLWKAITHESEEFGNPDVFASQINKTKWTSFTITFTDPLFLNLLEKITHTKAGTEGPVTIKDSNWLISFAVPNQPHFAEQAKDLLVLWGYGLFPDKQGNFVKKKMSECSGREIMLELIKHLRFDEKKEEILSSSICIPCALPYITSQFMPRKFGDRPKVVPNCSENFAFIGQFCEVPEDIVFTLEYSVRSAQIAVCSLLSNGKKPTPLYRGWRNLKHVFNTVRTAFR